MKRLGHNVFGRMFGASYRLLLYAYPREFRCRVGADMVEVFGDLYAHEVEAKGLLGLSRLAVRTLVDVARNGVGERLARHRTQLPTPSGPNPGPQSPRGERRVSVLVHDLRFAARTLRQQPLFSLTVVFVLALGIAGTTGIFSIFNGLFLRPLPFDEPVQLVNVDVTAPQWNLEYVAVNYTDFAAWRSQNETFEAMAVFDTESLNMSLDGEASRVETAPITHDIFDVLRIEPLIGHRFTAEEDRPGAEGVVLVAHALWVDRFAADPGIVGKVLMLDSEPHTVIGVLPAEANFISGDLWVPLRTDVTQNRGSFWLSGVGRLKPGVTVDAAREDLSAIHRGMIEERPVNDVTTPVVIPVLERILGDFRLGTMALLGGVSVVLVIACANIAGLMLARSTSRAKEVGIRVALGAGRRRIAQQLLTESLLLAAAGAALGVGLGYLGVHLALAAAPDSVPQWISVGMDVRFALFTTAITVAATLLFGFGPALRATRVDPQRVLQAAARATAGGKGRRSLDALVVCEIALALVLLISAGLFITAFQRLQEVDPGFVPESVLSYRISLPDATYAEAAQQKAFFDDHLAAVAALPGVTAVGAASAAPLGGHTGNFFQAEGTAPRAEDEPDPVTLTRWATQDYFEAIGVTLLAGRTFNAADVGDDIAPVVVVNQSFAEHHWPDQNPIGKRIAFASDEPGWITVIGLAQDVKHYGLSEEMRPGVYFSADRAPRSSLTVVVRTAVDPLSVAGEARALVRERDPDLPIYQVTTMARRLDDSLWPRRASSWTFAIFAGVALVLAVSGTYGVVSYAVGRRSHEIGIRMALGAQRRQVLGQVIRHGAWLLGVGIVLGLAGALAMAHSLSTLLFGVSATEPTVFVAVTLLLAGVALLANLLPARRAASIDPVGALREE